MTQLGVSPALFLPSHPAGIQVGKLHEFRIPAHVRCLSGCPARAVWQTCPAQVAPDGFLTRKGGRRTGGSGTVVAVGVGFPSLAMIFSISCHAELAPALVELPQS
jgi:hypothetical protein